MMSLSLVHGLFTFKGGSTSMQEDIPTTYFAAMRTRQNCDGRLTKVSALMLMMLIRVKNWFGKRQKD